MSRRDAIVLVGILLVLIVLLSRFVEAARESARRMTCSSSFKQLSLALQNYHDQHKSFPFGNRSDGRGGMGVSFFVACLPYYEAGPTFNRWSFGADDGDLSSGADPGGGATRSAFANTDSRLLQFKFMFCPSSPLSRTVTVGGLRLSAPTYCGVAGADQMDTWNDPRPIVADNGMGRLGTSGVLLSDSVINLAAVTDGTSNTLAVGECSNWTYSHDKRQKADRRPGVPLGFPAGCDGAGDNRRSAWLLTLRSQSHTTGRLNATVDLAANPDGIQESPWHRRNTPFSSAHRGGVQFGRLDGSVTFLANGISPKMLARACVRNDGAPVSFDDGRNE